MKELRQNMPNWCIYCSKLKSLEGLELWKGPFGLSFPTCSKPRRFFWEGCPSHSKVEHKRLVVGAAVNLNKTLHPSPHACIFLGKIPRIYCPGPEIHLFCHFFTNCSLSKKSIKASCFGHFLRCHI